MNEKIIEGVSDYYSNKIRTHGNTSNGVDWNSKESQYLRFDKLSSIINSNDSKILDYGCGTGEFVNFLNKKGVNFLYTGYDISSDMIQLAKFEHKDHRVSFTDNIDEMNFDYTVASGIFNVKLDLVSDSEWEKYIIETIIRINQISKFGFSFNALTKYSDKEYMKDYLFYADPLFLFDYCKLNFSKNVALLHDYDLYEFTLLIRK